MGSLAVNLAQDIEQERRDVEVECLVIQEELGEQAKELTVQLVVLAVELIDGERAFPVDLLALRLSLGAVVHMKAEKRPHSGYPRSKAKSGFTLTYRYVFSRRMYFKQYSQIQSFDCLPYSFGKGLKYQVSIS